MENPLDTFQHVVVLMLENRSFDNLLGFLYKPEDIKPDFPLGKKYAGLYFDGPHGNPVPGRTGENLYAERASDYFQPYPDPGEFYPHVNTQLYGSINPPSNLGEGDDDIVAPYNLPDQVPEIPPMNGFIQDYVSVLKSLEAKGCLTSIYNFFGMNRKGYVPADRMKDFKVIMECFQPDQVPALATLARHFAVFDHWHCDVPSQTYTNRAFFHAGTAWGSVNNSPYTSWIEGTGRTSLFNRLSDKGINWNIYTDNPISLTAIIHFKALEEFHLTNFKGFNRFLEDARHGDLPAYSFVEPRFITPHNDQHPSSYDSTLFGPSSVGSVQLGEKLIVEVYNAIRNGNSAQGSNWKNTLLIITHDEHGGCFDHIPPHNAPSPDPDPQPSQDGFMFNRLGIRVPMIMISAHILPNTIVNEPLQHTSFLKTMCEKWGLEPFTERDQHAPGFESVFTSASLRDVSDWPVLTEPHLPAGWEKQDYGSTPLNELQKAIVRSTAAIKNQYADEILTVRDALEFFDQFDDLPGVKMDEMCFKYGF
jgi:phospholipase C